VDTDPLTRRQLPESEYTDAKQRYEDRVTGADERWQ